MPKRGLAAKVLLWGWRPALPPEPGASRCPGLVGHIKDTVTVPQPLVHPGNAQPGMDPAQTRLELLLRAEELAGDLQLHQG